LHQELLSDLAAWGNFYVIIGSAAAALTGLQFIVIVLAADRGAITPAGTKTFGTPTIVHFCAVLLLSAILSTPWHAPMPAAVALGICGAAGLAYVTIIFLQARRQSDYRPVLEDWIWHSIIPFFAYAIILVIAVMLKQHGEVALMMLGAATILLLFTGIHNAWDAAVYVAVEFQQKNEKGQNRD